MNLSSALFPHFLSISLLLTSCLHPWTWFCHHEWPEQELRLESAGLDPHSWRAPMKSALPWATPYSCFPTLGGIGPTWLISSFQRPKRYLVIFLKTASEEVSSDDEEDLEEQEWTWDLGWKVRQRRACVSVMTPLACWCFRITSRNHGVCFWVSPQM